MSMNWSNKVKSQNRKVWKKPKKNFKERANELNEMNGWKYINICTIYNFCVNWFSLQTKFNIYIAKKEKSMDWFLKKETQQPKN